MTINGIFLPPEHRETVPRNPLGPLMALTSAPAQERKVHGSGDARGFMPRIGRKPGMARQKTGSVAEHPFENRVHVFGVVAKIE